MLTIHKYKLKVVDGLQEIIMPENAMPLTVALQNKELCLWAEVETDEKLTARLFRVIGTGHPIPENCDWVATVQESLFVWHIYEQYG